MSEESGVTAGGAEHAAVAAGGPAVPSLLAVNPKVIVGAGITALGGLLFGYGTGVISGALLFIGKTFPMTSTQKEILTSLLLIGAMIGAAFAGRVAPETKGRALDAIEKDLHGIS